MTNHIKQYIALNAIKVLQSRFESFPKDSDKVRNAPFHKAFLKAFESQLAKNNTTMSSIIGLNSWLHGLNTTLGQSFFENVAQILCGGAKRSFNGNDYKIYSDQETAISEYITALKNGERVPSLSYEDDMLTSKCTGELITGMNFVADCFFEDDQNVIAVEMKSVRPNSGEMRGEKHKILRAKAALRNYYMSRHGSKNVQISYFFGFPFDPSADTDTGWCKKRFMQGIVEFSKFCSKEDFLIADELWSFLSGEQNTMAQIISIIEDISKVSFMGDMEKMKMYRPMDIIPDKYKDVALQWHLYDELKIINHWNKITQSTDKKVIRYRNASVFDSEGKYNEERAKALLSIIDENNKNN